MYPYSKIVSDACGLGAVGLLGGISTCKQSSLSGYVCHNNVLRQLSMNQEKALGSASAPSSMHDKSMGQEAPGMHAQYLDDTSSKVNVGVMTDKLRRAACGFSPIANQWAQGAWHEEK